MHFPQIGSFIYTELANSTGKRQAKGVLLYKLVNRTTVHCGTEPNIKRVISIYEVRISPWNKAVFGTGQTVINNLQKRSCERGSPPLSVAMRWLGIWIANDFPGRITWRVTLTGFGDTRYIGASCSGVTNSRTPVYWEASFHRVVA